METNIFETHYDDYCSQVSGLDFSSISNTLGIEFRNNEAIIPFLDKEYIVSDKGVTDASGRQPNYMVCVILFKYLLLCPEAPNMNREWAFKNIYWNLLLPRARLGLPISAETFTPFS